MQEKELIKLKKLKSYLGNNGDVECQIPKMWNAGVSYTKVKLINLSENVGENTSVFLAVNPQKNVFVAHSRLDLRQRLLAGAAVFVRGSFVLD